MSSIKRFVITFAVAVGLIAAGAVDTAAHAKTHAASSIVSGKSR
jgi:hypothetical protein